MRGLARLRHLARGLRIPRHQRALILCYHRVATVPDDPFSLCVSPDHFEEHLAHISEMTAAISLSKLTRRLSERHPLEHKIVVTFDDGYADNLHAALPALERFQVPATFYIATGCIGREREFWWDELEFLTLGDGARREEARAQLLPLDAVSRDTLLASWNPRRHPPRASHRTMTTEELIELARSPLVEIGAHTRNHLFLPAQPVEVQSEEIIGSREWLSLSLGQPVLHFSYPYGEASRASRKLVTKAGFESAVTCASEFVGPDSDLLKLPRFFVHDWPRARFAAQLERWLQQ